MDILNLRDYLGGNPYPGRGIILGRSDDNSRAIVIYFIMGRSENSRNRIFSPTPDGIRTEAFDPSLMTDPSLIIYNPLRILDDAMIITNGDQTDTIRDHLHSGGSFESALRTREFEPDKPNYTPRISGLLSRDGSYKLSILKSHDGDPSCCKRFFFEYDRPIAGTGHIIHTYSGDGDPLPSFEGEPKAVALDGDIDDIAGLVWESLNEENKVSLLTISVALGEKPEMQMITINKHERSRDA